MAPKSKRTLGREHSDDSDVIFVPSSEAVAHTRRPAFDLNAMLRSTGTGSGSARPPPAIRSSTSVTTSGTSAPARAPAAAGEILPDRVQSSDDSSAPAAGREDSKKTKKHKGKNDGKEKESGKKQKKDKRAKKDKEEEDKDLPDADHRPVGAGRGGDDDDDDLFDGLEGLDEMMSGSEADDNQKGGAKKKPASTRGKGGTKKRPSKKAADMEVPEMEPFAYVIEDSYATYRSQPLGLPDDDDVVMHVPKMEYQYPDNQEDLSDYEREDNVAATQEDPESQGQVDEPTQPTPEYHRSFAHEDLGPVLEHGEEAAFKCQVKDGSGYVDAELLTPQPVVYSGAHKNAKAAGLSPKSAKRAALDARKEWIISDGPLDHPAVKRCLTLPGCD